MTSANLIGDHVELWLAINRAPGLGPARATALLERAGCIDQLPGLGTSDLLSLGVPREAADFLRAPDWPGVEQDLRWLEQPDHHLVTRADERYPERLKELHDAPVVLFVRGDRQALCRPQLAIVGSCNPTSAAAQTAREFANELAAQGITITSGLALGIDAAAHRGAISADGFTVGVLGHGPDQIYPRGHGDLAAQVVRHGALVTEFPVGEQPRAGNFPRRNRIISGLSVGVLVVEAALRSGSLITARFATEQGREVMAMPGSMHNPMARGCHALIRQGAKLVETVADILEEIAPGLSLTVTGQESGSEEVSGESFELDDDYRRLLELVSYDPTSVDSLVNRSGLTAQAVSSMLLQLELGGFVASVTGGLYTRTPRNQ